MRMQARLTNVLRAAVIFGCLVSFRAVATDLSFGSVAIHPGGTAQMPLVVNNAAPGISAFAVWFTNAAGFPVPTVSASSVQTNVTVFLDPMGAGLLRVTGFVLNGAPITNGPVAVLQFTAPESQPTGSYPVAVAAAVSPNPEVRALVTSSHIPAAGATGFIHVPGSIQLTTLTRIGSAFQFSFDGIAEIDYQVRASTNLLDWTIIGAASQVVPGVFQFSDPDADLFSHRFYRIVVP